VKTWVLLLIYKSMNEEIQMVLDMAEEQMTASITHLEKAFIKIRAGKANPIMLSSVTVDYYGTQTPLSQVANVNTPAHLLAASRV
jgi:ribosome recycling factor